MDGWVEHEIAGCHMRDARLKRRLGEVLRRLAEQPEQSIPAACQSWAQTQAAYRFLDNDHVSPEDILEGHGRATLARIAAEPVETPELAQRLIDWYCAQRLGQDGHRQGRDPGLHGRGQGR
jgi:hypothetical protein